MIDCVRARVHAACARACVCVRVHVLHQAMCAVQRAQCNVLKDRASSWGLHTLFSQPCLPHHPPLQEGEFLMPGLIDTHVHAPQVSAECGLSSSCCLLCAGAWRGLWQPCSLHACARARERGSPRCSGREELRQQSLVGGVLHSRHAQAH